jgi:type IV pilus assembly protein PilE
MKTNDKKNQGFTLIELLISLSIIAILGTIAYPSYVSYVNRSHRSDALSTLSQLQLTLERCYSQNFSYSAACTAKPNFPITSPQTYYTISIANLGTTTYTLTATTAGNQTADTTCKTMSVNQANVKTAFDSTGAAQTACWNP